MRPKWHQTPAAVIIAALVIPPLGLLLLWMRPRARLLAKVLGTVLICAVGITELFAFYGMRVELDGTGSKPIVSFGSRSQHYADIERDRTTDAPPPAVPTPDVPAKPESAPAEPAAKPAVSYWTDFRGPVRDGHYRQAPILTKWPGSRLEELWRKPIGGGYASMVVAEGRLFTIEQRREKEVVAAYDAATGRELWSHSYPAFFQESMGGDGPRATPTWHDGLLYSLGATGELRVLEAATGKVRWQRNILSDNKTDNLQWGMSASPLIVDDKVVVQPGAQRGASIVAYNKASGAPVWKSLNDKQAYTSPMLATLAGRRQIITITASRVIGVAPEDGALLWAYPWVTEYDVNSSQPLIVDANRILVSAGYGHGAALVEVKPSEGRFAARAVWSNNRMKNRFNSSVLHDGHVYGLDEANLACVNVETGELKWKGGRYGYGQLLLADGHLVVLTEDGDVVLVKAAPESHQELARFSAINGKTWNVPAIDSGRLFVRNMTELAAYRIGAD